MNIREKLIQLAGEKSDPSVTISMNTHRTHPHNSPDSLLLKNLLKEAEIRIRENYDKREVAPLLEKMAKLPDEIDSHTNLDSLQVYVSNTTKEILKLTWPSDEDKAYIDNKFDLRTLIKAYNRCEEYQIVLLSQGGVHLYRAMNEEIVEEILNEDFPFDENPYYVDDHEKRSDAKLMDAMIFEFFNEVDKALVKVYRENGLRSLVVCTEDNYVKLMKVANVPEIYWGHLPVNYNKTEPHQIVKTSWERIKELQSGRRSEAIREMKDAISQSHVITDLQEIYQAAIDGRGDLLIISQDFSQPVIMKDERTLELTDDTSLPEAIDDITSHIAWEVLSKKGRVVFTSQEEIRDLGSIVMKVRY